MPEKKEKHSGKAERRREERRARVRVRVGWLGWLVSGPGPVGCLLLISNEQAESMLL